MIDGRLIGINGLDEAINSIANSNAMSSDSEIAAGLLEIVSGNNYIPASASAAYGKALLREYQKTQGQAVPEEKLRDLTIYVLGMGCARCDELIEYVRDVLSEMQIAADLRHITDVREIAKYGVMGTPALVINKKVVSAGIVPPKSNIRQWITEAYPLR